MALTFPCFFFFLVCFCMLKCERRARISFSPSPNAIMAGEVHVGFCSLRRTSLFAFFEEEEVGKAVGERVCTALNPLEAAWGFALA